MLYLKNCLPTKTDSSATFVSLQDQVDNGIPISVCLRLFQQWVTALEEQKAIAFLQPETSKCGSSEEDRKTKLAAIATWSGEFHIISTYNGEAYVCDPHSSCLCVYVCMCTCTMCVHVFSF